MEVVALDGKFGSTLSLDDNLNVEVSDLKGEVQAVRIDPKDALYLAEKIKQYALQILDAR